MSQLIGTNTEVNPTIMSGESYGMSTQDAGAFPGSYAPIQGNKPPSQCGGRRKRRTTKRKRVRKNKTMKNKSMKRKGKKSRKSRRRRR